MTRHRGRPLRAATTVITVVLVVAACGGGAAPDAAGPDQPEATASAPAPATTPSAPRFPSSEPSDTPSGPVTSDGRPSRARLTIPDIGVTDLVVEPYEGWTDDAPGTDIQNRGLAASPHGPRGGTGPGGVGNYQVTAHRNTATAAFFDLPSLRPGQRVHVDSGGVRYTYEIRGTRETSFRSPRSLAEQRAAVPGRPGVDPRRAMLTLSTCATQEDHAEGNYWADEFDNPEHRIDKIGVLVRSAPLGDGR